ncbi:hypothetical protein [Bacillus sp. T33-2]|uniref:hypothetical protein n=1 Tax=Bacillus sp. T33-2 TaxID=2054168 RepID=UPI000C7860F7|nr:hypothetical protein [Bacillus sp. T33-2]PLR92655.1 hypothetical protein CVD19_20585 [Bacillus sp. T33-2]
MMHWFVLSLFLYFPEDKSEYVPAAITCLIFLIGAVVTMRLIMRVSKKEAEKATQLELELKQKMDDAGKNS